MPQRRSIVLGLLAAGLPGMALGEDRVVVFSTSLRGDTEPTNTGSKATGQARIAVNLGSNIVDLDLTVSGITLDQLWDNLVKAPIGPIHFHHYGSHDHGADAGVTLILPVPYGPDYSATRDGFKVSMTAFPYARGAALLRSGATFDDFVSSMENGMVVLNVHSDAFHDGEISGTVAKWSL